MTSPIASKRLQIETPKDIEILSSENLENNNCALQIGEIVYEILSYLSLKEYLHTQYVNRQWNKISPEIEAYKTMQSIEETSPF